MGFGSKRILITGLVDEHGGDREREDASLWRELEAQIRDVVLRERYRRLAVAFYGDSEEDDRV